MRKSDTDLLDEVAWMSLTGRSAGSYVRQSLASCGDIDINKDIKDMLLRVDHYMLNEVGLHVYEMVLEKTFRMVDEMMITNKRAVWESIRKVSR